MQHASVQARVVDGEAGSLTDCQVMECVAQARPDAFAMLYDRFGRLSFSLSVRILGNPQAAEDAVQEAFLSVWRRADTYRKERGSVQAWICSIVYNRSVDRLRGHERRSRALLPLDAGPQEQIVNDAWSAAAAHVEGEDVREALRLLPVEQRQTIELAYFAGYTQAEISDRLRVPLGTVKSRTRLALRKLHGALV